jgi:hypothetical protein
MNEEIKVPEVTPTPPPEIEPDTTPVVQYIHFGDDLRKGRDEFYNSIDGLKYVPIVGWVLYGVLWVTFTLLFNLLIMLGDLIDALWNGIAGIINAVAIWWKNFTKAVEQRYHGNWYKAIIDMAVQFLLMYLLEQALNIPAIKQIWDIFVAVVQKINTFIMNLRNSISTFFKNVTDYINRLPSNLNPLIKAIFKDEINFWTSQFNSLISNVESSLMKRISELDDKLTAKYEQIINTVNNLLKQWNAFKKEMEKKAVEAIESKIIWAIFKIGSPLTITLYSDKEKKQPIRTYNFDTSQIEATYLTTVRQTGEIYFNLSNYVIDIIDEIFDDRTELGKKLLDDIEMSDRYVDDLLTRNGVIISLKDLAKEMTDMSDNIAEHLEEIQKGGVR